MRPPMLVILLVAGVAGCGYSSSDDMRKHYMKFGTDPPQGNKVTVCHAYSCKQQTAYAIGHIEAKVGAKLGINDRAGMQFTAANNPTQQDCVDEATNTTSYLLVLQTNGLLKHHTVEGTMYKQNLARGLATLNPVKYWPHFAAVLKEKESGQKYAVDSWSGPNGENPAVVKVEDWYIKGR